MTEPSIAGGELRRYIVTLDTTRGWMDVELTRSSPKVAANTARWSLIHLRRFGDVDQVHVLWTSVAGEPDPGNDPFMEGKRYALLYQAPQHKLPRTAVMTFLDLDGDRLVFDARPAAGTQQMPAAWVQKVRLIRDEVPHHVNTIQRGDDA